MKKFFVPLAVFLIFFEFISLIFTKFGLFYFNEEPKYSYEEKFLHDWIELDNDGIVWHKKNYETRHVSRCFDVLYKTNNVGARDNSDYFKKDKKKSIILIGDSFAEGPGVDIDKIFAKIVEKKTGKKVLNFGNSGTEPKTQLARYLKFNKDYNFDEMIYFFLPQNDYSEKKIVNSNLAQDANNEKKIINLNIVKYNISDFLARFTYTYNFLRTISYLFDINYKYNFGNISYFYKIEENINYTFSYVEKIISTKKVKSYIIIIPTIYDINNFQRNGVNYKKLHWYKKMIELSDRNKTKLIDLMDYINFEKKSKYFHSCDGHWSEYGNSFAADVFLKNYNLDNLDNSKFEID